MSNGNTTDWLVKLQDSLTALKVSSGNVESKVEQLVSGMAKLEASLDGIKNITSSQETRITVLEERLAHCSSLLPDNLNEDMALIKSQLSMYRKFIWMISSVTIGLVAKMISDMALI
jgi:chromosome segregation ATPase